MEKELHLKFYLVNLFLLLALSLSIFFTSCVSIKPQKEIFISRNILDKGVLTSDQLADFFLLNNTHYSKKELKQFADIYIREAKIEGINSDVAFAQMCLETGYLSFGNLVTKEMNNFCGLGAMDAEHPGERFDTPALGVRAHIQHLQAYATTEDVKLKQELIDPRYNWVHRTKHIKTIFELAGSWAMDKEYGNKINDILYRMERMVNNY